MAGPDPAPAPLAARPALHAAPVWGGFALALLLAPLVFSDSLALNLLGQMGIAIVACLSYNLLLGQGGMLSFGHAVYSGAGAFLAMHTLILAADGWAFPVSLIPLVGGLAGLLLALVLGWITTRSAATPFAMITLGMGELVWAAALMFPAFFGGEAGLSGNRSAGAHPWGWTLGPPLQVYYLIAAYTFVCTALMFAFTRTPLGRLLNAVRDNAERVAFVGHDPHTVRYLAFVIAGFFAGVAGGMAALLFEIVTAEVLSSQRSGAYLLFTVLGGTGFFAGPVIGAILMVLALAVFSEFTHAWLLYLGLAFVLTVMFAPGGIASLLAPAQRRAARDRFRARPWTCLALAASLLAGLSGLAAMVEMAYQLQLRSALGDTVRFLGWSLQAGSPRSWLLCAALGCCGLASFAALARRLAGAATPSPGAGP